MLEPDSRSVNKEEPGGARTLRAADFLRAHRAVLLSDWEQGMHALHADRAERHSWLMDHMPELLLALAEVIEHGPEGLGTALWDEHAVIRLDQGFDLGEVASEYALLRKCILRRLEAEPRGLAPGELERLEEALDRVVTRTMTCFSQARQRILQALDRMTQATLDNPPADTLLMRLLTVLMESALAVDTAAVMMLEGDRLVVRAAVGLGADRALGSSLRRDEGFMGQVATTCKAQALRSATTDPRVLLPSLREPGLRAVYGVPLMEDERLLGVAYMGSRTAFIFSDPDTLLFRSIAQRATAYLVQARLRADERAARVEAQRSLAQLDALLAATPVGIAFLDTELRYVRLNQAMADINGLPLDGHQDRSFREVHLHGVADTVEPILRRALETGEPVRAFEYSLPNSAPRGGGRRWQASFYPVRTALGEVLGLGCAVVDITEHKQSEAALRQAVDFREQLLAVLGHDLRNPLNAISASAFQLSRAEALGAPERRAVDRIRKATARMGRMINDILDFARSRLGGGIPVARQRMNMAEACQAALEELQVSQPERQLHFEAHGDTWGDWDPDRVSQVLGNLVSNAIQHGLNEAPVRTCVRGEPDEVVLEVHNLGEPIPAELMARIFDPFKTYLGPPDTAKQKRSLGLGLYIVSQIAGVHGGSVEVRSTAQDGTTFTVHWPRVPPPG
ncbi:PAS domain-containing protein [Pyxidicoccus sp. MSG2]|uniref:PAS domain-containing protein n=1 Tax=Pyxidicoccus sp. MSG2 TaxID=2996790 RepID=UPI00226F9229|nr:PAS domain-containing protein [Pyxidicoccus sp. MSG2]MCY1018854.1 PAS domain-containing protein [Pyxidicoccus sp. MSG2]